MTFLEHLDELRKRIVVSLAAIGVGCLVAFTFVQKIYDFVMDPLNRLLPKGSTLVYNEPTEAFVLYVKMALLAGVIMAMPVILSQAWLFVAPGLYAKEKRLAAPFVVLATVGFVGGAAFTHYLLFPWMWTFFASFANDKLTFYPRVEPVFALYVKMILGMGLVFQMPAVVYSLARIGLVTARFLIKSFKYAILIIFVAAAVDHAERRHADADAVRGADDRALHHQHRHRLGVRKAPPDGTRRGVTTWRSPARPPAKSPRCWRTSSRGRTWPARRRSRGCR